MALGGVLADGDHPRVRGADVAAPVAAAVRIGPAPGEVDALVVDEAVVAIAADLDHRAEADHVAAEARAVERAVAALGLAAPAARAGGVRAGGGV